MRWLSPCPRIRRWHFRGYGVLALREEFDALTAKDVKRAIAAQRRVELLSERIMRELRRTSNIEVRTNNRA